MMLIHGRLGPLKTRGSIANIDTGEHDVNRDARADKHRSPAQFLGVGFDERSGVFGRHCTCPAELRYRLRSLSTDGGPITLPALQAHQILRLEFVAICILQAND